MSQQRSLVVVNYHPQKSEREKHLEKSQALSFAAKVSHKRRQHRREVEAYGQKRSLQHTREVPQTVTWGVLQRGNSDPFDATNIKITPEISSLLSLWHSHIQSSNNKPADHFDRQSVALDFSFANSSNTKLVVVSSSAMVLLRISQNDSGAVERRTKWLRRLHALRPDKESRDADVANGLSLRFIALLLLNAVDEARQCLPVLNDMLMRLKQHDPAGNMFMTARTLLYDWQMAIMYLRPLVYTIESVVLDWALLLVPFRQWCTARLPAPTKVSSLFFTDTLVRCFRRLQGWVDFECEGFDDSLIKISPPAQAAALIEPVDLWSTLFGHWIKCHNALTSTTGPERSKLQNEIVACVAALGFSGCIRFGPRIMSIREIACKSMAALRTLLSDFDPLRSAVPVYRDTWVWACYIGALWEYESGISRQNSWFIRHLSQKVRDYDISSWTQLQFLTDAFVRVPLTHKPGTVTFLGMKTTPATGDAFMTESLSNMVFDDHPWGPLQDNVDKVGTIIRWRP
jgi:hypothetical protein